METDLFILIIIIAIIFCVLFWGAKIFKSQTSVLEGLTNNQTTGVTSSANSYSELIKSEAVKLQDSLLVSKYRTDYENVILNMDDFVNMLMLNLVLNMKNTSDHSQVIDSFNKLNTLTRAKESLNTCMQVLDKT
jgi:hypothetical protein